jgi:hypothetical protein
MLQLCYVKNINSGEKMQEKSKNYLKNLMNNIQIGINDIEFEIIELQKDLSKLRKFYNKVIKAL